jgi:transposase
MRRFARTLHQDIAAVQNAMLEPWSNGQTERQISIEDAKRTMYGRTGIELLRARLVPLYEDDLHRDSSRAFHM